MDLQDAINNRDVGSVSTAVKELKFYVLDENKEIIHRYEIARSEDAAADSFRFLNDHDRICENCVVEKAFEHREQLSFSISCGKNRIKHLHILPFETELGDWLFACLQLTVADEASVEARARTTCALNDNRLCLLFVDSLHCIRAVNAHVPRQFGYEADTLAGTSVEDLFDQTFPAIFQMDSGKSQPSVNNCVCQCLDGSRLDVEVITLPAADGYTLFVVYDSSARNQLEQEVIAVSNRERRRIGQDLHDSLGQLMTGISLLSRSLSNKLKRDGSAGVEDATQLSELADEATSQLHYISLGLMPSEVVGYGLGHSLKELARITSDSCGMACRALVDDTLEFQDVSTETHLYRIAQEAVNNAVRHSGSNRIDILVSRKNGAVQLSVVDNGRWKKTASGGAGIGLKTMRYRAQAIGGELKIEQGESQGTAVRCLLAKDIPA